MSAANGQTYASLPQTKLQHLSSHVTNAQNVSTRLGKRYEQLLRSQKHCDCVFHIGTVELKCHKLILSAASPVFDAMFYGPIREEKQAIDILDISAEIFYELLNYIYTGGVNFDELSLEETIELYYGAEKYLLTELIDDCLAAIKMKFRFANILPALELSVCMNLRGLLEVCVNFFTRCCLSDPQYMEYLKHNYLHVSKECVKTIIEANQDLKHLLWYVFEWCKQECFELGLQKTDCKLIISDLQLNEKFLQDGSDDLSQQRSPNVCKSIERCYFRACRPFTVDYDAHEWQVSVKCNRFISLMGIVINSRLMPPVTVTLPAGSLALGAPPITEYMESLQIEICAQSSSSSSSSSLSRTEGVRVANRSTIGHSDDDDDHEESDGDYVEEEEEDESSSSPPVERSSIIWRHSLAKQPTKFNCDLNIQWEEDVILSPDVEYKIRVLWQPDAYGAEYPCSLQSNEVDGIKFRDFDGHCGSLIKGLRFLNLV